MVPELLMRLIPQEIGRLGIDIVHGCQLRCIGCPNSILLPKVKYMSLKDSRVMCLRLFNFGEPLLHHDVPGILNIIPKQLFEVGLVEISTNAQVQDFPMLAEIFKTGMLDRLVVSCDGDGTKDEYERLRPPAKWEKLIEFLTKAKEYRDACSKKTRLVTRNIVEDDKHKQRWIELLEPLGFTPHCRPWIRLPGSKKYPLDGDPRAIDGLCQYMQKKNLYVDYDGTVVPCCVHPRAGVLGNLMDSKYSEIYRSNSRRDFVEQLRNHRKDMAICGKCDERPRGNELQRFKQRLKKRWSPKALPRSPVLER
jgi:radical SAM protein with 4Fe4S-binding SPASM domain